MSGKSLFLAVLTVGTTLLLAVPQLIGLQSFAQWGGMYTDHWCQAILENPSEGKKMAVRADGALLNKKHWAIVNHNAESCVAWAHSWCNHMSSGSWLVTSSFAFFQNNYLEDGYNVCTRPNRPSFSWFER